jgi:hypothetical protein
MNDDFNRDVIVFSEAINLPEAERGRIGDAGFTAYSCLKLIGNDNVSFGS